MHAPVDYAYVGCFHEDNQAPDLTGELPTVITNAEACLAHCSRGGWSYAAVHNQNICTCGDSLYVEANTSEVVNGKISYIL